MNALTTLCMLHLFVASLVTNVYWWTCVCVCVGGLEVECFKYGKSNIIKDSDALARPDDVVSQ